MLIKLLFPYLLAVWDVSRKIWLAPDRARALKRLSASERFVVVLTIALVLAAVKGSVAL